MKSTKIILFFLILILPAYSAENGKTLAHKILDIDKKYGFDVSPDAYKFIDSIISEAERRIATKESYSKDEALAILDTIAKIHREFGINTPLRRHGVLFHHAVEDRSFDCNNYVCTYLSIAEKLDLPLYAANAPRHVLLVWESDSVRFFWETIYSEERTEESYKKNHNISDIGIANGIYLHKIENDKVLSAEYNLMGILYKQAGIPDIAYSFFKKAVEQDSNDMDAQINLLNLEYAWGDTTDYLTDIFHLIKKTPNLPGLYNLRAKYQFDNKNYYYALGSYLEQLKNSKIYSHVDRSVVLYNVSRTFFHLRQYDSARKYAEIAIDTDSISHYPYYLLGIISINTGDLDCACKYWEKAVKHGNSESRELLTDFCNDSFSEEKK